MKNIRFSLAKLLLLLLMGCTEMKEQRISASDVPPPVLSSFRMGYPSAQILEFSKEIDKGMLKFEISCTIETRHVDVSYTANGRLIEIEETIDASALPEPVRMDLERRFPQSVIELAEKLTKNGELFFEVKLMHPEDDEGTHEILFSPDGQTVEEEVNHESED
jgi:hypothetical protein